MLIGELSEKSGMSRDTIRFYEKKGLVKGNIISRRQNNYKEYSSDVLEQLLLVKVLRRLSFSLEEIKKLSADSLEKKLRCEGLTNTVDVKINIIDSEMKRLKQVKEKLVSVKSNCNESCTFDKKIPSCLSC
ncbi:MULTISPECIES: MerR family transcriptional regulator [Leptospira]|uniref:MerR family transcriptional regulator n=1 Tax=Leptospira TaxID=171 RepID=UPI001090EC20|nr:MULTISPECIES: MerR family transcriptional regulator [Leptospira]TGL99661.1 MerR family transcriptional regulator [Leptospira jelokensis]TGM80511.1 MerR family transcriptional regulator [Leptospira bouyouniensis]